MNSQDSSHRSLINLLSRLAGQMVQLAHKQARLVQVETRANVRSQTAMIILIFIAAGIAAVAFLTMVATAIIALHYYLPLWLAGVIVIAGLLVCCLVLAFLGLRRSVKAPWVRTREVIRSNIKMAREGLHDN